MATMQKSEKTLTTPLLTTSLARVRGGRRDGVTPRSRRGSSRSAGDSAAAASRGPHTSIHMYVYIYIYICIEIERETHISIVFYITYSL